LAAESDCAFWARASDWAFAFSVLASDLEALDSERAGLGCAAGLVSDLVSVERDAAVRGSVVRGSVEREAVRGSVVWVAVERDSVERDSAVCGSVERDASGRDSVERDAEERGSVVRGSVVRGSVLRVAVRGSVVRGSVEVLDEERSAGAVRAVVAGRDSERVSERDSGRA
jgi:hypothetical protein